ncbi:MAG: hypothetical protein AAF958_01430 [Planctomycetota bacterium]
MLFARAKAFCACKAASVAAATIGGMSAPCPEDPNSKSQPPIEPCEAIAEAVGEPQAATIDGQSVTNRAVDDLIKADQYLQRKKRRGKPGFGIGLGRMYPGSSVGE